MHLVSESAGRSGDSDRCGLRVRGLRGRGRLLHGHRRLHGRRIGRHLGRRLRYGLVGEQAGRWRWRSAGRRRCGVGAVRVPIVCHRSHSPLVLDSRPPAGVRVPTVLSIGGATIVHDKRKGLFASRIRPAKRGVMAVAGFCNQCRRNVWLNDSWGCVNGHGWDQIRDWYDPASGTAVTPYWLKPAASADPAPQPAVTAPEPSGDAPSPAPAVPAAAPAGG